MRATKCHDTKQIWHYLLRNFPEVPQSLQTQAPCHTETSGCEANATLENNQGYVPQSRHHILGKYCCSLAFPAKVVCTVGQIEDENTSGPDKRCTGVLCQQDIVRQRGLHYSTHTSHGGLELWRSRI